MSDANDVYWRRTQGKYQQPVVEEPPGNQNPNNARQAIWHLSRSIDMEVYAPEQLGLGWRASDADPVDDGRHDKGAPVLVTVKAVVQPELRRSGTNTVTGSVEGERSEGRLIVHLDSHQEENALAASAFPDLFPNGIRILGSDTEGTDERQGFATVFRFRNRRWKAVRVEEHFEGGDEDLQTEGAIYRAYCELLRDRSHEREATQEVADAETPRIWQEY